MERASDRLLSADPVHSSFDLGRRREMFAEIAEAALQRELQHRGMLCGEASLSAELIAWLEVA